ncbi:MAG: MoaD/ThiS family protein [Bacillota bacterium]|jgi:molybdopterin converting factor small subunit
MIQKKYNLIFVGFLNEYTKMETNHFNLKQGETIRDILAGKNVPEQTVGYVTANNDIVSLDYQIKDGDTIKVYPLVIGG